MWPGTLGKCAAQGSDLAHHRPCQASGNSDGFHLRHLTLHLWLLMTFANDLRPLSLLPREQHLPLRTWAFSHWPSPMQNVLAEFCSQNTCACLQQ